MKYVFLMSGLYLFEIGKIKMLNTVGPNVALTITITSIVDLSFPVVHME